MASDDEALVGLYAKRQDLLKQLSDVNIMIQTLEQQSSKNTNQNGATSPLEGLLTVGTTDAEKANYLLNCCVRDTNGLREAMKAVDACSARENNVENDSTKQKNGFRDEFVRAIISKSRSLSVDTNGSELLQHALSLLKSGGFVDPSLRSSDYILDSNSNVSELFLLLLELKDSLMSVCCDTNGTRVMQKLLDCLKTVEEVEFGACCFSSSIIPLCKDINGSHVVVRLLAAGRQVNFSDENGEVDEATGKKVAQIHHILYENFAENCIDVCENRQGCCIIQKCLQWAPEPYYSTIIDTILQNTLKLVHGPFGNYVIQFILDREKELWQRFNHGSEVANYTNRIIRQMLHNVASLSCDKFSSNVIEKCLKTSSLEVRQLMVDELTDPQDLPKLLTDGFANYVIQTAIATSSDDSQFAQLRDSITPLQNLLRNSPYGVKVEAKLARRQRETSRKQGFKKQNSRRARAHTSNNEHGGNEAILGAQIFSGMHALQTLVGTDHINQQAMAFSNVPRDMASIVPQPQYMPFMFPGQQTLFGL